MQQIVDCTVGWSVLVTYNQAGVISGADILLLSVVRA